MSVTYTKCGWCGKERSRFSGWEQKSSHGWLRLCNPCATHRLAPPQMRDLEPLPKEQE